VAEMLTKDKKQCREQIQMLCIEDLVPQNHILRDIDKAISFDFIYDAVKNLYCQDNGRPSVDPVVLIKIVLVKHLFGIRSIRQTILENQKMFAMDKFYPHLASQTGALSSVIKACNPDGYRLLCW